MNFHFISALHGNERMPVLALASMGVKQIVANPRALVTNQRYVDQDMNASFGTHGDSYEERRARELLRIIDSKKSVIDLHTFSASSPPFAIIVDMNMLPLAKRLNLEHVVYMKHNIKSGRALINHVNGVSVEVGKHADPVGFQVTANIVASLRRNYSPKTTCRLYEVYDVIANIGSYINFVKHADGFYPVLSGENAYNHNGLKAKLIEVL
jgi:hypothetical protein